MDLFDYMRETQQKESPLASRMRPKTLDEVVGQKHIIGKNTMLYRAIKADKLSSVIFYGPPGTGKTTLAMVIANTTSSEFTQLNATVAGKKDMEDIVKRAKDLQGMFGRRTILFIDEIHTLIGNDAQGALDLANMFKEGLSRGTIKMIGATTTYEYETYILTDKAFVRRFEKVDVEEPTQEMCVQILLKTLPKLEHQTGAKLNYTDFIKENIMKFIVNMTSEYKRVYEISSRYPDICLVILRQAFSNCIYDNQTNVTFKHIYDAIRFSKAVYPDVIKKELVVFKEKFKDELKEENVIVDIDNYLK